MMKFWTIAALATALAATPALAQTPAPATTAAHAPAAVTPAAVAPASPDLTKDGRPRMKAVRAQCREEIGTQDLKGTARQDAFAACILKQRPDMAAAMHCRMDPQTKGMDKDARRAFIKDCVAKQKG